MRTTTEIQQDLKSAYQARLTALSAQSYSLDTGQGKQMVQRANLSEINKTIRLLEAELESATASESGDNGVTAGNFVRY
jgi:hypothetical protein